MRPRFHWLTEINGPVTWLTAAFFVSRLYADKAGVVFYSSFVHRLWQAIDVELLQTRFWESIFYSHAQPPLFNVINGILVNLFPDRYPVVFHFFNITLSYATVILLYVTLKRLDVARWLSTLMCVFLILNPATIAYENLYSYTTLTVFLVMALTAAVVFVFFTANLRHYVLFVTALLLLVLTRSSFHLFWMIMMIALVIILDRQHNSSRGVIWIGAIGIILAASWYLKNLVLFNKFTASTWMGMNLARVLPPSTDLGKAGTFRTLEMYEGLYDKFQGFDDVPLLNNPVKLRHSYPNYYHKDYIPISDAFQKDFLNELRQHPGRYVTKAGHAISIFFSPPTHAPFIEKNLDRIEPFTTVFAFDFTRPPTYAAMQRDMDDLTATQAFMERNHIGTTYAIPAIAILAGLAIALTVLFRCKRFVPIEAALVIMLLVMYAYGVLVGILFEFGENNRFRLELQPVMFVLIPFVVSRLWNKAKRHKAF